MSLATSTTVERRVQILLSHFLNRTDRIGTTTEGGAPGPARPESPLDVLMQAHLLGSRGPTARLARLWQGGESTVVGRFRLGTYAPALNGTTRWVCIDIDGAGHSSPVADPTACAIATMRLARGLGLSPYLERSGGGHGWHVWVFFKTPIPAARARRLAMLVIPPDSLLRNGGSADAHKNRGIEIFPKADKVAANGVGNMVWLPWWSGAPEGANAFYDLDQAGAAVPCEPEEFATVAVDDVDLVLKAIESSASSRPEAKPLQHRGSGVAVVRDPAFSAWYSAAIQQLDLQLLYGEWLTGVARSPGWLQCRDPWSPTGDQHPSAGVADGTGQARRGSFHSFIDDRTLSALDFILEIRMAEDFEGACRLLADLSDVPLPPSASLSATQPVAMPDAALPIIVANRRQLREISTEARQALHSWNSTDAPKLFSRDGKLVELERGKTLRIRPLDRDLVVSYLARAANWVKAPKGDGDPTEGDPPIAVAADVLKYKVEGYPELDSIVHSPVFDQDQRLVVTPGYDRVAKLWYEPSDDLKGIVVPSTPSEDHVAAARQLLLQDVFGGFPFVDESGRAHILAALLLFFVRRMISGPTPLFHIHAPAPGTGKTLIVEAVLSIVVGHDVTSQSLPTREEEIMKTLLAALLSGKPAIFFDNLEQGRKVDSPALAQVLTSLRTTGRQLTVSEMVEAENLAVWFMTGNNLKLSQELARRVVPIRLDANSENPGKGREFKHPDLLLWIADHRRACIEAVITLVNAWISKGSPLATAKLAKFERWSSVTGGILEVAGIPGFLAHGKEGTADLGDEGDDWRRLVEVWKSDLRGEPVRATDLYRLCSKYGILAVVLGNGPERGCMTRLGSALSGVQGRVYGGMRIGRQPGAGKNHGYSLWQLDRVEGLTAPGS